MKISYITSMFPCWSETFILNEISAHYNSGVDIWIYSIKHCNEKLVHDEATQFIERTLHPHFIFSLTNIFLHFRLLLIKPATYFKILTKILSLKALDNRVKMKALVIFALAPRLIFHAREKGIEHLHAHFATYPAILAWIISSFNKTTFTVTAHAHDIYVNQDLLPIVCENSALIFAISQFNKKFITDKLGKMHSSKIKVLHCGINLQRFIFQQKEPNSQAETKKKKESLNILCIGRLTGIKGYAYLLDALNILKAQRIPFSCNIIGDGPLNEKLKKKALEHGLNNNVHFLGSKKTEEIPYFFSKADVFVLACAKDTKEGHDGIPLVFMEAMAYGTPVIGTAISGIPELIRHQQTGLCATPMDSKSLADAIIYFTEHPEEAERMRINARKLIEEEFDISAIATKQRMFFKELISDNTSKTNTAESNEW